MKKSYPNQKPLKGDACLMNDALKNSKTQTVKEDAVLINDVMKIGSVVVSDPVVSTGAKALCFYLLFNPGANWMDACKGLGINKDTFFKHVKDLNNSG